MRKSALAEHLFNTPDGARLVAAVAYLALGLAGGVLLIVRALW